MKFSAVKWGLALLALQSSLVVPAYASAASSDAFTDLQGVNDAKAEAIQEAVKQGLISGYPQGEFRPNAELSRQDFAVLLVKALRLQPIASDASFRDVAPSYAAPYIAAARQAGLLNGDRNGNFNPLAPVTRQEMAAVFVRAIGAQDTLGGTLPSVSDTSKVSGWAAESVDLALRLDLVDTPQDRFNPQETVKRQDIAALLLSVFRTEEKTSTIDSVDQDVVTIDGMPYLIENKLKQLIGSTNRDALVGARLKFNSVNRSMDGLQSLQLTRPSTTLDAQGLPSDTLLSVAADQITIQGGVSGKVTVEPGVQNLTVDRVGTLVLDSDTFSDLKGSGSIDQIQITNPKTKLTLSPNLNVRNLRLPNDIQPAQVIRNFNDVSAKIDVTRWENGTLVPKSVPQTVVSAPVFVTTPSIPQNPSTPETPAPSTNKAPIVVIKPKDSTLRPGAVRSGTIVPMFQDPDGDKLTYTATTDNPDILSVTLTEEGFLKAEALKNGEAVITITADDGKGGKASGSFKITVLPPNHAPQVDQLLQDLTISVGADQSVDLSQAFKDLDGDSLSYSASSSDLSIVSVPSDTLPGSSFKVSGIKAGTAIITVVADDGNDVSNGSNNKAFQSFQVTVSPANHAPVVQTSITDKVMGQYKGTVVDISGVFTDADNEALTYSVSSSDANRVAGPEVSFTTDSFVLMSFEFPYLLSPDVTITVTAKDPHGASISTSFKVSPQPEI